jgi:hypothetical protein
VSIVLEQLKRMSRELVPGTMKCGNGGFLAFVHEDMVRDLVKLANRRGVPKRTSMRKRKRAFMKALWSR